MSQWTVTIPTVRTVGAEPVHGTQTWIVSAESRNRPAIWPWPPPPRTL
ncbi:hypothetical protein [Streptomyces violascens]